jgi:uncharacterized protein
MSVENPIEVPYTQLNKATLRAVVEEFCTRAGTDYGAVELELESKVERVLNDFANGDVHLIFESNTESLRIVDTTEMKRIRALFDEPRVVED